MLSPWQQWYTSSHSLPLPPLTRPLSAPPLCPKGLVGVGVGGYTLSTLLLPLGVTASEPIIHMGRCCGLMMGNPWLSTYYARVPAARQRWMRCSFQWQHKGYHRQNMINCRRNYADDSPARVCSRESPALDRETESQMLWWKACSFIGQIFIEHLLCTRHCSRCLGLSLGTSQIRDLLPWSLKF